MSSRRKYLEHLTNNSRPSKFFVLVNFHKCFLSNYREIWFIFLSKIPTTAPVRKLFLYESR